MMYLDVLMGFIKKVKSIDVKVDGSNVVVVLETESEKDAESIKHLLQTLLKR